MEATKMNIENILHGRNRLYRSSPLYLELVRGVTLGRNKLDFISINNAPVCNFTCEKCFNGLSNQNNYAQFRQSELSQGSLERIISEGKELGAHYLEIQGSGEPFITQEFTMQAINLAYAHSLPVSILTNGFLLDERTINYLADHNVDLTVSLDYVDHQRYGQSVGRQNDERLLSRTLENLETVRQIYSPLIATEQGFTIMRAGLHTTLSNDNIDQIKNLRDLAGETLFFSVDPMGKAGRAANHGEKIVSAEKAQELIEKYSDLSFIISLSAERQYGFPICGSFRYGLNIDYDGDVLVDAHLLKTRGMVGNIEQMTLSEAVTRSHELVDYFFEATGSRYFCPMRDQENFQKFLKLRGR